MYITMHCGGMPFNGDTINKQSLGGSETAAYYLAKELAAMGHRVTLFTNEPKEGRWDGVRYSYAGKITEQTPLGDRFHMFAMNVPHDVCIIQRHPQAFQFKWASKINLLHLHDLALRRNAPGFFRQLWNVNGILCVSEYHKKQIVEAYGISDKIVHAITNGIDLELFKGELYKDVPLPEGATVHDAVEAASGDQAKLLYSSRPERGLEWLVKPSGIMERLLNERRDFHLYVCNYANVVPQMADYYAYLYKRCEMLPNVTVLGHLTKQHLASVMRQCDALVYPTPGPSGADGASSSSTFREVSCITAMECMGAGLPFLSSQCGALPETCKDSGSILIPLKEGKPDLDLFVTTLKDWFVQGVGYYETLKEKQLVAAQRFSWKVPAQRIIDITRTLFDESRVSDEAVLRQLERDSDIYALWKYVEQTPLDVETKDRYIAHLDKLYSFAIEHNWRQHYEDYYRYERERGVAYGPETMEGNERYEAVADIVAGVSAGGIVLDYGCAHGHYTVNLAKRYPRLRFIGLDLAESNIETARKWAEKERLKNVAFYTVESNIQYRIQKALRRLGIEERKAALDLIIAAEVLEHVEKPAALIDELARHLKSDGKVCITTPYGPWEAQGYERHYPWRAHLHHFERADLADMFGMHEGFGIAVVPAGISSFDAAIGSYLTMFKKPKQQSGVIDYERKFATLAPEQTVSLCMIVKDAEQTIAKCLSSVLPVVTEVVIAIDKTTSDNTLNIIRQFQKEDTRALRWEVFTVDSPLEVGFDAARNETLKQAKGDWILWLDADEHVTSAERLRKYLRQNKFNAYAIAQHHFSFEPLGVIKTDYPTRLFRNHRGVQFYGVVHEHPEEELNKGIQHVMVLQDVSIGHPAYETEEVRKLRFQRNINLMVRDREKYPDRLLGKFLWVRDLSLMNRWEYQDTNMVTPDMIKRAEKGLELWEEVLESGNARMIYDSLQYYSELVKVLGEGYEMAFQFDASKMNGGVKPERAIKVHAHVRNKDHMMTLFELFADERTKDYDYTYF